MKETLEEAKYNAYKESWREQHTQEVKSNFLTAFELGAKWQQEQDNNKYNESDLLKFWNMVNLESKLTGEINWGKIFEQFNKRKFKK